MVHTKFLTTTNDNPVVSNRIPIGFCLWNTKKIESDQAIKELMKSGGESEDD
jgi:hypothetical protein